MNKIKVTLLFIFLFLLNANIFAESNFLRICNEYDDVMQNFEYKFKVKGCDKIYEKLTSLTSFSEIYYSDRKKEIKRKILSAPWTDDFPYLYGLNRRVVEKEYFNEPTDNTINVLDKYSNIYNMSEFANLTDISYLPEFQYYRGQAGICEILQKLPQINTVTIEWKLLLNPVVDKCLSKLKTGVIIRDQFKSFGVFKPITKVIGIEFFTGDFVNISNFKHLRYIGVSNTSDTLEGIESIYKLSKISHFSMNIQKKLTDSGKLAFLRDLEYLNITCIKTEIFNSIISERCDKDNSITKIDFIADMIWLKHLNLSFNNIEDLSPLLKLSDLVSVKLRGNKISSLPDLSSLENLSYLDLSGNELIDIKNIKTAKGLYFLNLSGNSIKNIDSIASLDKLKFLNLSNNPGLGQFSNKITFPSVKVLNLNGRTGQIWKDKMMIDINQFTLSGYENEKDLLFETLYYDFNEKVTIEHHCSPLTTISNGHDLSSFRKLDILYATTNRLTAFPIFSEDSQIRLLNLESNSLKDFHTTVGMGNILELNLGRNDFDSVPDIRSLKKLKSISFSQNLITEVKGLTLLKGSNLIIDLMNNLIKDVSDLTSIPKKDLNQALMIYFTNNIIEKDQLTCPTQPDYLLKEDCALFLKGIKQGNIGIQLSPKEYEDYPAFLKWADKARCK
jgi:hypothetical protein